MIDSVRSRATSTSSPTVPQIGMTNGAGYGIPYPLSNDVKVIGMDVLDHLFFLQTSKSVSRVDFGQTPPPTRCLDLGCGSGAWIMDAAKQWKDTEFVGFDYLDVQPKLYMLPVKVAERVQWVHGNFLERLPFEDNSFDHVHIHRIAWGVPEQSWDHLCLEIERILCPGGVLEWIEEDVLFPILPRSYTTKSKARQGGHQSRVSELTIPPTPIGDKPPPLHAHVLLESLYFGVFEERMINPRPTVILSHFLNTYFRNVLATIDMVHPFPPPPMITRRYPRTAPDDYHRARSDSNTSQTSISSIDSVLSHNNEPQHHHHSDLSPSSPDFPEMSPPLIATYKPETIEFCKFQPLSGTTSTMFTLPSVHLQLNERILAVQLNTAYQRILACKEAMWGELQRRLRLRREGGPDLLAGLGWDDEDEGEIAAIAPASRLSDIDFDGGGGGVLGLAGIHHTHLNRPFLLHSFPLSSRDSERSRTRFEEFVSKFERDMRYRTALADMVEGGLGWQKPRPMPLSKSERLREAEVEAAAIEASRAEMAAMCMSDQEFYSRRFKGFVGLKEGKRRV
ncbi:hypothetical protein M422DRAFT_25792 [Sphaerobolus stellatus SS14]|nr:hypothetical protein M422DRAFT_25792 [Sphaerobolus stellatus SS14]